MQNMLKRVLSLVLVLVLAGSMLPVSHAHAEGTDTSGVLTDEDYAIVNDVFAQIDAMEDAPAKRNASQTQLTDAAIEIVKASENYVEGSLERNGDSFTWWTDEGIRCIYDPRMREKYDNMVAPEDPLADGAYNEPVATKGGWPSGNQVYLIAPYYGIDDSFTDQYRTEATDLAEAIGDTDGYTLYSGSAATVDKVAEAISNGAVVIFDSHGTTDYTNPNDEYEYVTGAKYSYLCLTSKSGLTSEDYNDGAAYFTDSDGHPCVCVNGAAIANHMTKKSPAGILWMAICLGMATNTMCKPMREMGVEVVYGYSQSVSFAGDYLFEETFWDNMCAGKDVATSIAAMKTQWGNWDWSTRIASYYGYTDGYSTISAARSDYAAFPIVVSDEDTHPGQKTGSSNYGADTLQTVKSTYTLFSQYAVTAQSNHAAYGTVSASGSTITAVPAEGYFAESATVISGTATVMQSGNTFSVLAQSDCTVQINFAPKTVVTVNFFGTDVQAQTGYAGDTMSLPTAEAPQGYTFLGWMDAPLSSATMEKPSYYTDSFIPTGNTTLYALYKYVDTTTGEGGSGDYVKVTETPEDWSGEYVIVYEAGGYILDSSLAAIDASGNYMTVTITDNTIAEADAEPYKFTIAPMSGGYSILGTNGKYIGGTSGSNTLNASSSALLNTIALDTSGNATIVSNTSRLRFNTSDSRFRYYKSGSYTSQKPIALYRKDVSSGTVYYVSTLCDHASTSGVAAVAPTCTETGYTAGVLCTDCQTYISGHEVIAALGHDWSEWEVTTAPGCETAGEQTHTCSRCGGTETEVIPATGHTMDEGKITTAATCTEAGIKTYTCTACGATETEVVPATGHSLDGGKITTAPTCTEEGVKTYTCTVCGASKLETVPVTEHTYVGGVCSGCGIAEVTTKTYVFADYTAGTAGKLNEEHVLDDIVTVTTNNAYFTTQLRLYNINETNYKNSYAIIKSDKVIKSIAVNAGYKAATLNVYGSVDGETWTRITAQSVTSSNKDYTVDMPDGTQYTWLKLEASGGQIRIPRMDITFAPTVSEAPTPVDEWNVVLGDDLNTNFYLNLNTDDQVRITVGTEEVVYDASKLEQTENGKYIATVSLTATQMTDEITIQVVDSGDEPVTYTIRQYAETILDGKYSDETKRMVREMLNYGAMAQVYFNHNTGKLANENITDTAAEKVPETIDNKLSATGRVEGISFYAASLVYRERIALRFYFEVTGNIGDYTFTADGTGYEPVEKDGYYYIEVSGITPDNLDKQVQVTVAGAEAERITVSYSPMNYIVRMNAKGGENLQNLLKALYNYHLAAAAYQSSISNSVA